VQAGFSGSPDRPVDRPFAVALTRNGINKRRDSIMNKDRIEGTAKQAAGAVKEGTGKVFRDGKLVEEGKAEKVEGKIQNTIGRAKDALKR
jgi:uncharacterized protein YjbJ (UPF0337 family)